MIELVIVLGIGNGICVGLLIAILYALRDYHRKFSILKACHRTADAKVDVYVKEFQDYRITAQRQYVDRLNNIDDRLGIIELGIKGRR